MPIYHNDVVSLTEEDPKKATISAEDGLSFKDIIQEVVALKSLLQTENELLKKRQYEAVKGLQDRKNQLIRKLEIRKELLKRGVGYGRSLSEAEKKAFQQANDGLNTLLTENYNEALIAKEINRKVVDAVVRAVKQHENAVGGYNAGGYNMNSTTGRNVYKDTTSLAVNESI